MSASPLPELRTLEALIEEGHRHIKARVLCEIPVNGARLPVHALTLGNPDPACAAVGFFGGVHGLERIGAEVVLTYLRSLLMRLAWDEVLHRQLENLRLVFMPLVNPGGTWLGTRANPAGVDLMRNAPIDSAERVPPMVGGQRISRNLPWYRGEEGAPMEPESQALCDLVERELLPRPFAIAIDCHSGFGLQDRLWFPYARSVEPIAHLPEMFALAQIFDAAHAHHRYVFEPQSRQYLTHGDLWDHLYQSALSRAGTTFLPLTLEMGSWLWVKKNPRQLFSRHGMFNPLIGHRQQRVMRRHLALLDFFTRAASSWRNWTPAAEDRERLHLLARALWYDETLP